MFETLQSLFTFHGPGSKGIVWEHNSHVGNALATEMSAPGFVQGISRVLGLKADRTLGGIPREGEVLPIAVGQQRDDRFPLLAIRGGGEAHRDYGLAGDDMTGCLKHVRQ